MVMILVMTMSVGLARFDCQSKLILKRMVWFWMQNLALLSEEEIDEIET